MNTVLSEIASKNSLINLVKSDGLYRKGDTVHFDAASYRELGLRYANDMIKREH